jgi:hypothetical protein
MNFRTYSVPLPHPVRSAQALDAASVNAIASAPPHLARTYAHRRVARVRGYETFWCGR